MSDPRLSSPSSIRLVAASAAAVASLSVVALGVQLGTAGLVGDGPGRNPGSTSATPASATVELPRSRPGATLDQRLISLVPAVGTGAFGSSSAAASSFSPVSTAAAAPAAPAGPAPSPSPAPAPAPSPSPTPAAPTLPAPGAPVPTPAPTIPAPAPAPAPTVPPALDPVLEPVGDVVDELGVTPPIGEESQTAAPAPAPTLDDLVRLLLGP